MFFTSFFKKYFLRKVVIVIICIFILPLIITWYLYPEMKLGRCEGKKGIITSEKIFKMSARSIFADILQIPLNLKWYDIYILTKDVNCRKPATIFISFIEGNPNKYSASSLLDPSLSDEFFTSGENVFKIPENGRGQFTYSATDFFTFGMDIAGCSDPITTNLKEVDKLPGEFGWVCEVYAKPNIIAWVAQYFVTAIITLFIFSSSLAIFDFIRGKKRYNV